MLARIELLWSDQGSINNNNKTPNTSLHLPNQGMWCDVLGEGGEEAGWSQRNLGFEILISNIRIQVPAS
jgi:hypothetical protein